MEGEFTQQDFDNLKARVATNINYLERIVSGYFDTNISKPIFNADYNGQPVSTIKDSLTQLTSLLKHFGDETSKHQLAYVNYLCLQIETIELFNEELQFLKEKIYKKRDFKNEILNLYSIIYRQYRDNYLDLTQKLIEKLNFILAKYNIDEYLVPKEDELWRVFLFKYDLIQRYNNGYYSTSTITLDEILDIYSYSENLPYYTSLSQLYSIKRLIRIIIRRRLDYLDHVIDEVRTDQNLSINEALYERDYLRELFKRLITSVIELDNLYEINKTRGQLESAINDLKNHNFDNTISEINIGFLRTLRNNIDNLKSLGDGEWLNEVMEDIKQELNIVYRFYAIKEVQSKRTIKKLALIDEITKLIK